MCAKTKKIRRKYQTSLSVRVAPRISPGHMHTCKNDSLIGVLENYTCSYKSTCQHACTHTHTHTHARSGMSRLHRRYLRGRYRLPLLLCSPVLPLSSSASSAVSVYSPQIISQEKAMVGSLHFLRPCHPPVSRPPVPVRQN